jgi:hypothetical protein
VTPASIHGASALVTRDCVVTLTRAVPNSFKRCRATNTQKNRPAQGVIADQDPPFVGYGAIKKPFHVKPVFICQEGLCCMHAC